ncbi:expressed protein [Phakopsora pachyrhizi]|uniref:Expressed protein n=1 Tax=Phakopsora pachyrhizi TaxID=170000 RepID=A0AAV0BFT2_PHAPC|nr:expressed protein [Phakopsora pachyrhizi]
MCKMYKCILCFLIANGVLFRISMAMESDLIGITRDLESLNQPNEIMHGDFFAALASDVLTNTQQKVDVTQALKNTEEKRERLQRSYGAVQLDWMFLKKREDDMINLNFNEMKEAMDYISILTRSKLQEIIAHELQHESVHLKPVGDMKILKGSEISTEVISAKILANLKDLVLMQVSENKFINILFSRQIIKMVEYLLKQSFISNRKSLEFFQDEKALDMMAEEIFILFHGSHKLEDLILSTNLLEHLIGHDNSRSFTSILQSLGARENKYLLKKILVKFLNLYNIEKYIDKSQLDILREGYESLTNQNFNIQNWMEMHNDFRFINNGKEELSELFLYRLTVFHILKVHMKYSPELFSNAAVEEINIFEKTLKRLK